MGSVHTVEALDQSGIGRKYQFARWSDNGARAHSITVSSTMTSYTATFGVSYLVTVSPSTGGTATIAPASVTEYYAKDSSVDLKATPAAGYCFVSWLTWWLAHPLPLGFLSREAYWLTANLVAGLDHPLANVPGGSG